MRQIRQRVAVRAKLRALTPKEGIEYIKHRMAHAGANPDSVFTPAAIKAIVKASEGYPRAINILCDNALVTGLGYQCKPIPPKIAREVIREFRGARHLPNLRWIGATAAGAAIASAAFMAPMFWNPTTSEASAAPHTNVVHPVESTQEVVRTVEPVAMKLNTTGYEVVQ